MQLLLKLKNGKTEEMTMDEARELYNELHQIFGQKQVISPWPHIGTPRPFNPLDAIKAGDTFPQQTWISTSTKGNS